MKDAAPIQDPGETQFRISPNEALKVQMRKNPVYGAFEFLYESSIGGGIAAYEAFDDGSYGWGSFHALTTLFGVYELRQLGLLGRNVSQIGKMSQRMAGAADDTRKFRMLDINKVDGKYNCVNCAIAVDNLLKGTPSSALNSGVTRLTVLEDFYNATFKHGLQVDEIANLVSESGSRGIVFGNRGTGQAGHAFNVVNQNGTIRFLDGQTGAAASLEGYVNFSFLPTN